MSKKEIFLRAINSAGLFPLARQLANRGGGRLLTVLAYHRIVQVDDETRFPFDTDLISASPQDFEWQLRFLKSNFDVMTFGEIIECLDGHARVPHRPIVVSFDDGFEDNFLTALPILRSVGIPATFFITTGPIGGNSTFWFDRLANLVWRAPVQSISMPEIDCRLPLQDSVLARRAAIAQILHVLKHVPEQRRCEFLDSIYALLSEFQQPSDERYSRAMTWDQVRELSRSGMEIGSHTVTHPILTQVTLPQLTRELVESKRVLETELGKKVDVVAYPVGIESAFSDSIQAVVRSAGYRLGCSYVAGVNRMRSLENFAIRRQHVERTTDHLYFEGLVSLPRWIY